MSEATTHDDHPGQVGRDDLGVASRRGSSQHVPAGLDALHAGLVEARGTRAGHMVTAHHAAGRTVHNVGLRLAVSRLQAAVAAICGDHPTGEQGVGPRRPGVL